MADYKIVVKHLVEQAKKDPTKIIQVINGKSYTAGQLADKIEDDKDFRNLVMRQVDNLAAFLFSTGRT